MLENQHEAILHQLSEGVIVSNAQGRIVFVNGAASRLHGVAPLDIEPGQYSSSYHLFTEAGEPYPPHTLPLARAVRGETVENERWRIRRPDGTEVLAVGSARPVHSDTGLQIGSVLTIRDDTARELAARQVQESEARLRALTDNLPGAVVYQLQTDPQGQSRKFLYVSQTHEHLTGVTAEAVMADASLPYEMVHPGDRPRMFEAGARAIREKMPYDLEVRYRKADGEERWSRMISAPREQEDGSLIWDGLQIDVTERVLAERALQELNATLERRVEQRTRERDRAWKYSRDLQIVVDRSGIFKTANEAWQTILGWDPEDVVGKSYLDFIHFEDLQATDAMTQAASSETTKPFESRLRHRDGTYRWISWVAAPEGELIYASGRHITAEKEAQVALTLAAEQLRQAQKMEAVGQLTGGIAHDFNNLLAGIMGCLEAIERRVGQGKFDELSRYIEGAQGAAQRAAALTQRLLAFSRRQTLEPKPTDVVRLVEGMEDLIRGSLGPGISLSMMPAAELWTCLVDGPQLENALLNLCINARDSMPDGGALTIRMANKAINHDEAAQWELAAGEYLHLSVSDTGAGMTKETMERAFDPFFTTKPIGQGTGLGLSMIYGFIRQSKGHVEIQSQEGRGTTVSLYLRRSTSKALPRSTRAEGELVGGGGEVILVIDDEPLVRWMIVEALEDNGYQVLEAEDGPSGLRLLEAAEHVDLLVTDVGLPKGMNGRQVSEAALVQRPDLKVLFVTGYAETTVIPDGQLGDDMGVLAKPFSHEELIVKISELLIKR